MDGRTDGLTGGEITLFMVGTEKQRRQVNFTNNRGHPQ